MPIAAAAVDICQPTGEKKRKEVDLAANNESGLPKKRVKKRCSVGECTNQAVKGGVCYRHGARKKVILCSVEECTNQAQNGGVCYRHGAKVKLCSFDNCTNYAQKGGVCIKHGAKLKRCSVEECTNYTVKGGVCTKHGANGDRCKFEGCTGKGVFNGFCGYHYHQEPRPNQNDYNLQIQQQQQQQQQQQILGMGLASTMSSLGYRHRPPQWNNYNYDNSLLNSNRASLCNFEGCNIIAIHGRFCWRHSASSFAPHARADIQRGYIQGGGNPNAPTEIIIIDAEEAGEKEQGGLITSRKRKEGVAKQSETPLSSDTGEYCPDEFEQDGRGHRCAVEDGQSHDSDKSLAAGVASLKDDNEQDTSDTRPQRRVRREVNLKDDAEQDASDVAPTQGGDEGGTGGAMENGDSWGGDGQNEYNCEGLENGDAQSEEGNQSHVLQEEIRVTANDDEKEHDLLRLTSELEEPNTNNMVNEKSEEPADRNKIMPTAAATVAVVDICQPTAKKKRKEVDLAANNGSGPPKKRVRKRCRYECSAEGCNNRVVSGGVCVKHGAKVNRCSVDDCTNQVVINGGVCITHGAKVKYKLCSVEECTNYTVKGGVCTKHGANGDRCEFEGCTGKGVFNGFCGYHYHQEPRPNNYYYNLQIQQQQLQHHHQQQQQQQILRLGFASTMSSLGYRHHPQQQQNYYYNNSFLDSNRVISRCNFEGCNIVAIHGGFCFAHSASSVAPRAHADSQRGYVQGGGNQIAPTVIIIDAEEAGEKEQASITSRKQKEGVTEQSKTPLSSDTGEYCPDESEQDGRGHRCAVEDRQNDGSKGVASLKDDSEQDTSDMRPQRRVRREGNQKDDEEQDASDDAPTQGGDDGGTGDAMEVHNNWDGDGRNKYSCEGVDDGDLNSEEGKQFHVLPEEIRATANDDEKEHEIKKKSDVIAELEEEPEAEKAKQTEMDTQLMTTATSRLEERAAKDAASAKVGEMTEKFEAESAGAVAEMKEEVAARLELNASLRNQLETPSKGGIEVKEEELTDDEDFTARLKQKRTDQVLEELETKNAKIQELLTENEQLKDVALANNEELQTKNAKIQELTTENDQLKNDVRDKDQEIIALKQQLIEMVQNRAEIETSEMI